MPPRSPQKSDVLPAEIDRRYFAELLLVLEARLDVNDYQIGGVRIWPLVRWILARNIKQPGGKDTRDLANVVSPPIPSPPRNAHSKPSFLRRVGRRLGVLGKTETLTDKQPQRSVDEREHRHQIDEELRRLRGLGEVEFVVMAKTEKYYQTIENKRFSPITDPVFEDLQSFGATINLALEPFEHDCVHQPTTLNMTPHMMLTGKMPYPGTPADLEDFRRHMVDLNRLLRELECKFRIDTELVVKRFHRYARKRAYWRQIFCVLNPRVVFVSSFVGWAHLIWACRDLGITTVDIQHGGQSAFHYHTSHWTKVPETGYPLLPDFFWVWGETTANNIRPWLPADACRHTALVGGNRNLARWINSEGTTEPGPDEQKISGLCANHAKSILVTLGYSQEDLLPDFVREVMKARSDWFWLIRLHPLKRSAEVIGELNLELQQLAIENYDIENATGARLFALFRMVSHHVTPFSTSGREALALGVPTTIVHPIGLTYFSDDITAGTFDYAHNAQDLLRSIENFQLPDGVNGQMMLATDNDLVEDLVKTVRAFRPSP